MSDRAAAPEPAQPAAGRAAAHRVVAGVAGLGPTGWALVCAVLGCCLWLWWAPQAPDLAAQVARAQVARQAPWALWWTGWFAGLTLPT